MYVAVKAVNSNNCNFMLECVVLWSDESIERTKNKQENDLAISFLLLMITLSIFP